MLNDFVESTPGLALSVCGGPPDMSSVPIHRKSLVRSFSATQRATGAPVQGHSDSDQEREHQFGFGTNSYSARSRRRPRTLRVVTRAGSGKKLRSGETPDALAGGWRSGVVPPGEYSAPGLAMRGSSWSNAHMSYAAAFHCIEGCPGSYPVDQVIYRCPSCEGLLEVRHDAAA